MKSNLLNRVSIEPGKCGGRPCIRGMRIRVYSISAGPIRTLAAAGISDFRKMLSNVEAAAPMRRNVTIEDVGNTAAFLCSDLANGITGENIYVDNGYNIVGMTL